MAKHYLVYCSLLNGLGDIYLKRKLCFYQLHKASIMIEPLLSNLEVCFDLFFNSLLLVRSIVLVRVPVGLVTRTFPLSKWEGAVLRACLGFI